MKIKIILMIMVVSLLWLVGPAQVSINTDGASPDGSAILDVKSSTKGFLPPRMTNAEINAVPSPVAGLIIYCTDCNNGAGCLSIYEGGRWHCVGTQSMVATSCGNPLVYYPVLAAGYTWLDRNLGASQVATSSTDYLAYGSLYQWGRQSDGHQCIDWTSSTTGAPQNGTTTTQCSNGICPDALFVTRTISLYDWNTPTSNILWNGTTKGANDPCPSGYRVPSQSEQVVLINSFSPQTSVGAYNSPLKIPVAGARYQSGSLGGNGIIGYYWSSTYNNADYANYLIIGSNGIQSTEIYRAGGVPVRCIAQ